MEDLLHCDSSIFHGRCLPLTITKFEARSHIWNLVIGPGHSLVPFRGFVLLPPSSYLSDYKYSHLLERWDSRTVPGNTNMIPSVLFTQGFVEPEQIPERWGTSLGNTGWNPIFLSSRPFFWWQRWSSMITHRSTPVYKPWPIVGWLSSANKCRVIG